MSSSRPAAVRVVALAVAASLGGGAGSAAAYDPFPNGVPGTLSLKVQDDQQIEGSWVSANSALHVEFTSTNTAPYVFHTELIVNGSTRIVIEWDGTSKEYGYTRISADGNEIKRPVDDNEALRGLHDALAQVVPYAAPDGSTHDQARPHEAILRSYAGFLSEVSRGPWPGGDGVVVRHADLDALRPDEPNEEEGGSVPPGGGSSGPSCSSVQGPLANDPADQDGVVYLDAQCCNGGALKSFTWDWGSQPFFKQDCTNYCGKSYGCTGRCGPGCTPLLSFPRYNQDCFDHDKCVDEAAAILPSYQNTVDFTNPYCRDEFWEGADDVAELVILYYVVPSFYGAIVKWPLQAVNVAYCE